MHNFENQTNNFGVRLGDLYDDMIELYSKDHTTYFFGCPISSTHMCADCRIDIPESSYSQIMPCEKCEFEIHSYAYHKALCRKRFLDLNLDEDIRVIVEGRDKNGFINKISYLENGQKIYKTLPTYEKNFAKDIFTLWSENNCRIATFRNVKTGKYIKITKNPIEQFEKYHKVYGYFSYEKYTFSSESVELFGVGKKEWFCEWYVK